MAIDAAYVVRRARELTQVFGTSLQFHDGFAASTDPASTPILPAANEYLFELSATGYLRKMFSLGNSSVGGAVYTAPAACRNVLGVYYNGKALKRTSRDFLDSDTPGWRAEVATPTSYVPEGRTITLYPVPIGTFSVEVFGASTPALLTAGADLLEGLSDAQAIRVPFAIALTLATIDDTNSAHRERRALYQAKADSLMQDLAATVAKVDDYASVSADQYTQAGTTTAGRDGA